RPWGARGRRPGPRRAAILGAVALAALLSLWPRSPVALSALGGPLVVNEIDYDQPGADDAEFIELKNVDPGPVFLGDYDVLGINGATAPGTEYRRIQLPDVVLGPGEYFVIGAPAVPNVDMVITAPGFVQNGAPDAVAVVHSTPSDPLNDILVDSVSYEGDTLGGPARGGTWTEGSGVGLDDSGSAAAVNEGISRLPDGYDTDVNNMDMSRRCITPGAANTSAVGECSVPAPGVPTGPAVDPSPTPVSAAATPTGEPMAVTLAHLGAARVGPHTVVQWRTLSESGHAGFFLLRDDGGGPRRLNPRRIAPRGGPLRGAGYYYIDVAARGLGAYWLADVDVTGRVTLHGPVAARGRPPPRGGRPTPRTTR
ncbi:MAG: lamin tail domain-containing protein, partial [Anaerolineae bacterium]